MRVPTTPESVDGFIDRLTGLMQDDGTHLYFDTSFLMWLTAIGPISRAQFFAWAASLGERTHVPLWSMHEYYRHHCAGTLKERLTRSASELDAASRDFLSKVAPYADGPLMAGQPEAAYREALRIAAARLDDLAALAKDWNYEESAVEMLTWMNDRTCAGATVFDAMPGLIASGKGRYALMQQHETALGMGTTLAGAVLTPTALLTFNVGDSRCYLLSGSQYPTQPRRRARRREQSLRSPPVPCPQPGTRRLLPSHSD